ncbi:MAG: BlaI/MecI/CopY family transcriptional regulator [Bryobacteraceae bacterium]
MEKLSRRERQIMDVLYERGRATAAEILAALPDPPSYSSIRALIKVLEDKGHVKHQEDGPRYVFTPSIPRSKARRNAVKHLLQTFFDDSAAEAVASLLGASAAKLKPAELDRIEELIARARQQQIGKEQK